MAGQRSRGAGRDGNDLLGVVIGGPSADEMTGIATQGDVQPQQPMERSGVAAPATGGSPGPQREMSEDDSSSIDSVEEDQLAYASFVARLARLERRRGIMAAAGGQNAVRPGGDSPGGQQGMNDEGEVEEPVRLPSRRELLERIEDRGPAQALGDGPGALIASQAVRVDARVPALEPQRGGRGS